MNYVQSTMSRKLFAPYPRLFREGGKEGRP